MTVVVSTKINSTQDKKNTCQKSTMRNDSLSNKNKGHITMTSINQLGNWAISCHV